MSSPLGSLSLLREGQGEILTKGRPCGRGLGVGGYNPPTTAGCRSAAASHAQAKACGYRCRPLFFRTSHFAPRTSHPALRTPHSAPLALSRIFPLDSYATSGCTFVVQQLQDQRNEQQAL